MIQNLNQVTFQGYGTILPERKQEAATQASCVDAEILNLSETSCCIYRAASQTRITNHSGISILSVSSDNETYRDYYLDKPVWIEPGVYFSLTTFRKQNSQAAIYAQLSPEKVGSRAVHKQFYIRNGLHIKSLYTLFYQEKEQGFLFPGEAHPMLELTYVDQGTLHSVVDGVDTLLQQGDVTLYGPDQWHMQYSDMGVAPRFVTISFDAEGCDFSPIIGRKFSAPQKVVTLLQTMLQEYERMDPYSTDMILSLLTQTLLTLLREPGDKQQTLKMSHSLHSENEIISRAQQYISSNIRKKLSVPLVAQNTDVSASYLTSLFHKHLQISPGEYIRRVKLQESKQMIREDSMNFTEIAAALQYSTIHHFSRQFKEKFGITPTEYAKSVRG